MQSGRKRLCKYCSKEFDVARNWQIFCSEPCKNKWHSSDEINRAHCFYCGDTAQAREHVFPVSHDTCFRYYRGKELIPVCNHCNSVLGAKLISVEDKFRCLIYYMERRKGVKNPVIDWDSEELGELGRELRQRINRKIKIKMKNMQKYEHMRACLESIEQNTF